MKIFGWSFDRLDITIQRQSCDKLYSAGRVHEAAETFLKMMDTLSVEARASRDITDWVSGELEQFN